MLYLLIFPHTKYVLFLFYENPYLSQCFVGRDILWLSIDLELINITVLQLMYRTYVPFYNNFASFWYILYYCISTHFMLVFHFYIPCKRQNIRKVKCTSLCINPIQDVPFRGYSWMVWTKRLPLSKICNTYYPTMKLGATYGWCGQKGS